MKDFFKKYGAHVASATGLSTILSAIFLAVFVNTPIPDVSPIAGATVIWIILTAVFNLVAVGFLPHNPTDDSGGIG